MSHFAYYMLIDIIYKMRHNIKLERNTIQYFSLSLPQINISIFSLIYGISKDLPYIAAAKPYKPQIKDFEVRIIAVMYHRYFLLYKRLSVLFV